MTLLKIDISFITVNFNGLLDTLELIQSIVSHIKSVTYEIIVVDNASQQKEALSALYSYPQVKVILSPKNLGFAGGNNLGIKSALGRYLFFINNDTCFKDDHLIELLRSFTSSTGIVSPKICYAQPPHLIQYAGFTPLSSITLRNKAIGEGEPDQGQYDTTTQSAFAHGAAMLVAREVLEIVGPMSEEYFLYYEEMDWSCRFLQAGYEILYNPAQVIYHKESRSTGQSSPLKTYYLTRNRLRYANKFKTGISKYITISYLIAIVGCRDLIRHTISNRLDLANSVCRAIADFFLNR